jgi:hypothetical protein
MLCSNNQTKITPRKIFATKNKLNNALRPGSTVDDNRNAVTLRASNTCGNATTGELSNQ